MKTIFAMLLLIGLVALGGCKKNQTVEALPDELPGAASTVTEADSVEVIDVGPVVDEGYDYEAADSASAVSADRYEVRRGDTLWSISTAVYGDGKRWRDIASANGIRDPARLPVGLTLVIP